MRLGHPPWRGLHSLAAVVVALAAVLVAVLFVSQRGGSETAPPPSSSPRQLTDATGRVGHFEYVVTDGAINVYDIDRAHRLAQRIDLQEIRSPHGVVAHPASGMLYVSYGGHGEPDGEPGSVLAYDLVRERVVWNRHYATGIDSIAVTTSGDTLYVPAGEASDSGAWNLVDTRTGDVRGAIHAGAGAHNTVVSLDGSLVFLAGTKYRYLTVADTATNDLARSAGLPGGEHHRRSGALHRPRARVHVRP
jgi:DNA-binding beta-propeller fold protein YncE